MYGRRKSLPQKVALCRISAELKNSRNPKQRREEFPDVWQTEIAPTKGALCRISAELKNSRNPKQRREEFPDVWLTEIAPTKVALCRISAELTNKKGVRHGKNSSSGFGYDQPDCCR